eukprot:TRINITY_DN28279_c0_g1_i1.p1 TRINITY_DN28279_c0_g1~~TRINITY_DN28279_c0_g1_i1.p1  ORF type:complete len:126 (-),score=37.56 TRINITY_DN28279_c0_g1_i1:10-387(-)
MCIRDRQKTHPVFGKRPRSLLVKGICTAQWVPSKGWRLGYGTIQTAVIPSAELYTVNPRCTPFCDSSTRGMVSVSHSAWGGIRGFRTTVTVSYTHLRAHETVLDLVCRLLLEKKNKTKRSSIRRM